MLDHSAYGRGVATIADDGTVLDTWYLSVRLDTVTGTGLDAAPGTGPDAVEDVVPGGGAGGGAGSVTGSGTGTGTGAGDRVRPSRVGTEPLEGAGAAELGLPRPERDPDRGVRRVPVDTVIGSLADPPADAHDVYLRLHLLSHRLVRPNECNLDGVFGLLANVVWTSHGPCHVDGFETTRLRLRGSRGPVTVYGVDKFPRMLDYVVPSGVRVADADRVRLGAHLAAGTTVMHEGFVNFNAGTLGTSMVEGRVSSGVVVGDGSDVGGGASIMGTLSGGGRETISIGRRCLIGANAGIGISLGDDCVVEAGLYVTAGTKVTLPDGAVVKAVSLSGQDGLLFIRDSVTGAVRALPRGSRTGITLNTALHANQ